MPIPATVGAFAIIPSNDLPAAVPFWERLGLYEVGICGPDGLLVRIGWPSRLMQNGKINTEG